MRRSLVLITLALLLIVPAGPSAQSIDLITSRFERILDALRRQAGIPGLSASILQNGVVVWEAGLGMQDVERARPATPDTPYYLGDVTEVVSATLVLQCIEQGRLRFDDLLTVTGPDGTPATATVRQLLIHDATSGTGPLFEYNPARFAALTGAVERCSAPLTFRQQLAAAILDRLGMDRSLPGLDAATLLPPQFEPDRIARYAALVQDVAKPYQANAGGGATAATLPPDGINASVGLVASVRDLGRFDAALTSLALVGNEMLVNAWTPRAPVNGWPRPFGHGWFAQAYQGEPIVWHFGFTAGAGSALYLKLPARGTTLILLANSDGLTAQFGLQAGDVTTSPFARLFLALFR